MDSGRDTMATVTTKHHIDVRVNLDATPSRSTHLANISFVILFLMLTWIKVGVYGDFSKCHSAFSSHASPRCILLRRILWASASDCSHSDTPTTSINVAVETIGGGSIHVTIIDSSATPLSMSVFKARTKSSGCLLCQRDKNSIISCEVLLPSLYREYVDLSYVKIDIRTYTAWNIVAKLLTVPVSMILYYDLYGHFHRGKRTTKGRHQIAISK